MVSRAYANKAIGVARTRASTPHFSLISPNPVLDTSYMVGLVYKKRIGHQA